MTATTPNLASITIPFVIIPTTPIDLTPVTSTAPSTYPNGWVPPDPVAPLVPTVDPGGVTEIQADQGGVGSGGASLLVCVDQQHAMLQLRQPHRDMRGESRLPDSPFLIQNRQDWHAAPYLSVYSDQ
jgi:hypothetical protein